MSMTSGEYIEIMMQPFFIEHLMRRKAQMTKGVMKDVSDERPINDFINELGVSHIKDGASNSAGNMVVFLCSLYVCIWPHSGVNMQIKYFELCSAMS